MFSSTLVRLTILMAIIKCGENAMDGNVIGGEYADIYNFPHAVYLFAECDNTTWSCGSSVLNQWILLTAGHCVDECNVNDIITTYAGSDNIKKSSVVIKVRNFVMHEDYDITEVYCDIAVMKLRRKLTLGRTIKRVIMQPSFPDHSYAKVAGWGVTSLSYEETIHLKYVGQKVWTFSECNQYEDMMIGTLCASSGSDNDYPYDGDSGSGLVTKKFQVIGFVSYKGSYKELTFYTNVSYFYSWIQKKSSLLYCSGKS